jgi:hypothetical protein
MIFVRKVFNFSGSHAKQAFKARGVGMSEKPRTRLDSGGVPRNSYHPQWLALMRFIRRCRR